MNRKKDKPQCSQVDSLKYKYFSTRAKIVRFIGSLIIRLNRFRGSIYVKKKDGRIRLVINRKYEQLTKGISRFVLIFSLVFAFITIPAPFSIILSLCLISVEQILERVAFFFITIRVVNFPSCDVWKKANFIAMIYGQPVEKGLPMIIGMAFTDCLAAREVWSFIQSWAVNEQDVDNNLRISIIINEKAKSYGVFVYPSPERPFNKQFMHDMKNLKANRGKDHVGYQAQMMIIKVFPMRDDSSFNTVFLKNYKKGFPFIFRPYIFKDGETNHLTGIPGIMKNKIKIKSINDVNRHDREFHSVKYDINWNQDPSLVPQTIYYGERTERFRD